MATTLKGADFDERWLQPGGVVPVDPQTTGALVKEIIRLRDILENDRLVAGQRIGTYY